MGKDDERINYKETNSVDVIGLFEIIFFEYKWSFDYVMELPIPTFMEIIEALKRRKEAEIKAYEKAKGKKKGLKRM